MRPFSSARWHTSVLCTHRLHRDSKVRSSCGGRAAGVSSANENHLASCAGQMEARWEKSGGGRGSLGPHLSGLFPLPLASSACKWLLLTLCLLQCQIFAGYKALPPRLWPAQICDPEPKGDTHIRSDGSGGATGGQKAIRFKMLIVLVKGDGRKSK